MHINMSVTSDDGQDHQDAFMAGILAHIREITLFLNPHTDSYQRLGEMKAPRYISWSKENRSQLIRIPAMKNGRRRIELRSPDPCANPYLCYALLIHAGLDGIPQPDGAACAARCQSVSSRSIAHPPAGQAAAVSSGSLGNGRAQRICETAASWIHHQGLPILTERRGSA